MKNPKQKAIEEAEKFIDRIYKEGLAEDFADKNIIVSIIEKAISETAKQVTNERDRKWLKFVDERKKERDKLQQENTELKNNIHITKETVNLLNKELQKENKELKEKLQQLEGYEALRQGKKVKRGMK